MNIIKKTISLGESFLVGILCVVAGLLILSSLEVPNGIKIYTVLSGSMIPTLPVGSLIISQPQDSYETNDIITFKNKNDVSTKPKQTFTHRIKEVKNENNVIIYITKGDANNSPDVDSVTKENILGKTLLSIPFLGYVFNFSKTQTGFLMLIIIPSTIVIYSEILSIKNEIIKSIQKKTKKDNDAKEKEHET